jgi:hypothetical protein
MPGSNYLGARGRDAPKSILVQLEFYRKHGGDRAVVITIARALNGSCFGFPSFFILLA